MATSKTDSLFANSHPDISKRVNLPGLVVSLVLLVLGIALFIATTQIEDHSSASCMGLMALGTILILVAIFRLVWKLKVTVYTPTGSVTKMHNRFFELKDKDKLKTIIQSGNFAGEATVKSESSGNVRMDVMISEDKKFAAVQLFQFVSYTYDPLTPVQYYTNTEASDLAHFLSKCGGN